MEKRSTSDLATTSTVLVPVSDEQLNTYCDRVARHLTKMVTEAVVAGGELIAIKRRLGHGQFARLFQDHPNPCPRHLNIGLRYGELLMAVARNAILSNPKHAPTLPHSPSTLYVLSRIDPDRLLRAIDDGTVHPAMERSEAKALLAPSGVHLPKPRAKAPHEHRSEEREIVRTLNEVFMKYPDKRAYTAAQFLGLYRNFEMVSQDTSALIGDLLARLQAPSKRLPEEEAARVFADLEDEGDDGQR